MYVWNIFSLTLIFTIVTSRLSLGFQIREIQARALKHDSFQDLKNDAESTPTIEARTNINHGHQTAGSVSYNTRIADVADYVNVARDINDEAGPTHTIETRY
ncbi:hypothetical protein HI914_01263 [Erysiphe necator]|nr:hypothetical protein HI914_01263 [Erysiphe necator]